MSQYKLHYFNLRGRAELARLIFAVAGQQYEDVRIERENWPALKSTMQTGKIPVLEVHENGHVYKFSQSIAIARFLAKRFHLAGTTDLDQAEVDMYVDQVTDLLNEMSKIRLEPDESKKLELTNKFQRDLVPIHLTIFETKLNKGTSGYLVGNNLTFADLFLMNILERLGDKKEEILNNFPTIKKHDKIIRAFPNISKWLHSRPVTDN